VRPTARRTHTWNHGTEGAGLDHVTAIDLEQRATEIEELWSPIEVAQVNDQVVRLAKIQGEYHWHKHTNEDELFYVLKGRMVLQLKDQPDIALAQGEIAVVPKGMEHCPRSQGVTYILVFEPQVLVSRGD
jgi:mannose-6-phosphate isomerase-like protein (cupin superfamily)